jgi:tRNA G10  N-methylase Trm11
VNPSLSPFIKQDLEVIFCHKKMAQLILQVKSAQMNDEDFLIKYLEHPQENLSFKNPKITFGLTYINDYWYFGILEENKGDWYLHKDKPRSYSSAINARIAKALVNIATKGDFNKRIIDPCCGVVTILIEALYSGYTITGMDINKKVVHDTLENLAYFNYIGSICGRYNRP